MSMLDLTGRSDENLSRMLSGYTELLNRIPSEDVKVRDMELTVLPFYQRMVERYTAELRRRHGSDKGTTRG
jgi:hypothetical protein